MTNTYFQRYIRHQEQKGSTRRVNPERLRQNSLSGTTGFLRKPKDFDWLEKNIPCQFACPAKTDIPGYLDAIAKGEYKKAYMINLRDNVFPAILGRVCTRPCEPACRHGWEGNGESVAICFSKRSADTFMQEEEPVKLDPFFPPTEFSVGVVGSGAAGLAAARELALLGHAVTVYEKHAEPGGMMVQGIPAFRLPREIIQREIKQVELTGVEIQCGVDVGSDVTLESLLEKHDAVILSAGTLTSNVPDIEGAALEGVHSGFPFLRDVNGGADKEVGENVVVIGGGFTAVDCSRMAWRLGAKKVTMCYRRSEKEMYITPGEVEEMLQEGIAFHTHRAPLEIRGENGRVTAVRFGKTVMGEADETGRRQFTVVEGDYEDIPADTVLFATGQSQDTAWLDDATRSLITKDGSLSCGRSNVTPNDKLFIAGDFGTGAGSLIEAIGHGKTCAHKIDESLTGKRRVVDMAHVEDADVTGRTKAMDDIPRQNIDLLSVDERSQDAEVERGLSEDASTQEALRCYLCHYKFEIDNDLCIYCDRCLKVKPVDDCIVKISSLTFDEQNRISGYVPSTSNKDYNMLYIDQEKCIRCNACKDVCPVECISLQKVQYQQVVDGSET